MIRTIIISTLLSSSMAFAGCWTYSVEQERESIVCPGVIIPQEHTRNFKSEYLRCDNVTSQQIRTAQPLDEELWNDTLAIDRYEAAQMLRDIPEPHLEGTIHYPTHVNWTWESCEYVTSEYHCGSHEVCYGSGTDRSCHEEAKSCFADITHHNSLPCDIGVLHYSIHYQRKDDATWHPDSDNYVSRLANGYDLLPGEREKITTHSNDAGLFSKSSTITPALHIDLPKNEYDIKQTPNTLTCRVQAEDRVDFTVHTTERIRAPSPNAFEAPRRFDNDPIEPLVLQNKADGIPAILRVQDYSAATFDELTEQIQQQLESQQLKNTVIRVQLYEPGWWGQRLKSTVYIDEAHGIRPTLNTLSDDQSIRRSSYWELPLSAGDTPESNLYLSYLPSVVYYPGRLFYFAEDLSFTDTLKPNTAYTLKLTVYQKNVPFYYQSCEAEPDAWDCRWYAGWGWFSPKRYENWYFSDTTLDIPFTTEAKDRRTWRQVFWHAVRHGQNIGVLSLAAYAAYQYAQTW